MKRFFTKIVRFFWSWRFLKFILWSITIIVLLYVEEDWRGARDWAATKAKWEAKGESFDYSRLVPPSVPDDQNLAMIPLFKLEPDPKNQGELEPLALQRAYRKDLPGNNLSFPHSGNWQTGQVTDMDKIRKGIAANYAEAFPGASTSISSLAQFDLLYPFVSDLVAASATRPFCRFPHQYPPEPPYQDLMTTTYQIQVSKILNLHAQLALDAHQPALALADIETNLKITKCIAGEPFLVSGLVATGMTAIGFSSIYDGLAAHAWNDEQLVKLQNELGELDFLATSQNSLRGEMEISIQAFDRIKGHPFKLKELFLADEWKLTNAQNIIGFWPGGWVDLWKTGAVDFELTAIQMTDPKERKIDSRKLDQLKTGFENSQNNWLKYAPWKMFYLPAGGPVISAISKFAQIQSWVDEARIACGLERYRLAHGSYPDSLDALMPSYVSLLPHDIINGQPYQYHLRPDGTFLLYSFGWNQADDGGKMAYKNGSQSIIDYTQGDWVWPTPQTSKP